MSQPSSATPRRAEPQIGAPGPAPLRAPPPRLAPAKPVAEPGQALRFPGDQRSVHEPARLTLSAPERLTIASVISENSGPSRGVLRFLAFAILLGLAAIGAATLLHHTLGPFSF